MLKLEEIKKGAAISGLEPGQVVRVVTTEPVFGVKYQASDEDFQDILKPDNYLLALKRR